MTREEATRNLIAQFCASPDGDTRLIGEALKHYADGVGNDGLIDVMERSLEGLQDCLDGFRTELQRFVREALQVHVTVTPYDNLHWNDEIIDHNKVEHLVLPSEERVWIGDSTGRWKIPAGKLEPHGMWMVRDGVECKILGLVRRNGNVTVREA